MHILQVTPYFYPHFGGVESHVMGLSEGLINLGHEVEVVTSRYSRMPETEKIKGIISLPGDKSISHRAMLLNAMSNGSALISNFCHGDDRSAMINCLNGLGVNIEKIQSNDSEYPNDTFLVEGNSNGDFSIPTRVLDAGNSGTTFRLVAGLLATQNFESTIFPKGKRPLFAITKSRASMRWRG